MKKLLSLFLTLFLGIAAILAESQYTVTANSLNVRKYADKNSEVMFKVSKGDVVTVKEIKGSWAFIDVPKGGGWVAKKYLEKGANSLSSGNRKSAKKHRTTDKVLDEPVNKVMTWVIRIAACWSALWFIILFAFAIKRKKLLVHIFMFGALILLLGICSADGVHLLRFLTPGAIIAVLLWPLLYARISNGTISLIGLILMAAGAVALFFMFRVEFEGTFWVWLWTIVLAFVNVGIIGATITSQDTDRCPSCNYYADHPVVDTEYLDSSMSSETSTRDEYSHSETHGNTRTNYYTRYHDVTYYRHDRYRDTHRCMSCGSRFTRQRTTKNRVGSETY